MREGSMLLDGTMANGSDSLVAKWCYRSCESK